MMKLSLLLSCGFFVLAAVGMASAREKTKPKAVDLFDGKMLDGWQGKEESFRVEAGAIVAGSLKGPIPNNEFLCTKKQYGDFELRLKAELAGKNANAGIRFRSQRDPQSS